MPNKYSRSPAALLSRAAPGMASFSVNLGAHGGAMAAQGCAFVRRRPERPPMHRGVARPPRVPLFWRGVVQYSGVVWRRANAASLQGP